MRFTTATAFLTIISGIVLATPVPVHGTGTAPRSLGATGHYTVSGLGNRKKQLTACGANVLDLAIAMLEYVIRKPDHIQTHISISSRTERMSTDYTYGDGKSGDSANFVSFF